MCVCVRLRALLPSACVRVKIQNHKAQSGRAMAFVCECAPPLWRRNRAECLCVRRRAAGGRASGRRSRVCAFVVVSVSLCALGCANASLAVLAPQPPPPPLVREIPSARRPPSPFTSVAPDFPFRLRRSSAQLQTAARRKCTVALSLAYGTCAASTPAHPPAPPLRCTAARGTGPAAATVKRTPDQREAVAGLCASAENRQTTTPSSFAALLFSRFLSLVSQLLPLCVDEVQPLPFRRWQDHNASPSQGLSITAPPPPPPRNATQQQQKVRRSSCALLNSDELPKRTFATGHVRRFRAAVKTSGALFA